MVPAAYSTKVSDLLGRDLRGGEKIGQGVAKGVQDRVTAHRHILFHQKAGKNGLTGG